MIMPKNKWLLCAAAGGLLVSYSAFVLIGRDAITALTDEDNLIENLGALFFLLTSGFLFLEYFRHFNSNEGFLSNRGKNALILVLALMFFAAFGEEISWGQRIFGVRTPEALRAVNVQGEINLHNLVVFNPIDKTGEVRGGWKAFLNFSRLFQMFWFTLCVVIPLLNRRDYFHHLFKNIGVPIVPLGLGGFFLLNYFILKIWGLWLIEWENSALTEITEMNFAYLFFLVSCAFLNRGKLDLPSAGAHHRSHRADRPGLAKNTGMDPDSSDFPAMQFD